MISKFITITSLLLVFFGIGYNYKKYRIAPRIFFPEIEVTNEKKEIVKLENKTGKLRVISFYASWCHDCKVEFPKLLSAMQTDFSEYEFITITDEGFEKMVAFKDKYKYPFTFYTLPNSFDTYDIYAIPTTYILNSENEIIYSKVGAIDWKNLKPTLNQ